MLRLNTWAQRAALLAGITLMLGATVAQADGRHHSGHAPRHGHWYDGAHGHRHHYPVTGWRVVTPPRHVHWVPWRGVRYGYWNGVWYQPYGAATPCAELIRGSWPGEAGSWNQRTLRCVLLRAVFVGGRQKPPA